MGGDVLQTLAIALGCGAFMAFVILVADWRNLGDEYTGTLAGLLLLAGVALTLFGIHDHDPWWRYAIFAGSGFLGVLVAASIAAANQVRWAYVATALVALMFAGALAASFLVGSSNGATVQNVVANSGSPTPMQGCDNTGTGDWELQDLHGDGGRLLNGGADNILVVLAAAHHDPLVLRTFYLDLVSSSDATKYNEAFAIARANEEEKAPTVDALKCVGNRQQLYAQLVGILNVSTTQNRTMADVAQDYGLPVQNGQVRAQNVTVNGDNVGVGVNNVSAQEMVITVTLPNGAKSNHRTYCANALIPGPVPQPGMGELIVIKTDDGSNLQGVDLPVPGFHIIADGPTRWEGDTDGSGLAEFDSLYPGTYQVSEVNQPGWEPVLPASVSVKVEADQVVYARFKNRQVKEVMTQTPTATLRPGQSPSPSATQPNRPTATPMPTNTSTPVPPPTQTPAPRPTEIPPCCDPPPTFEPPPPTVEATATTIPIVNPTPTTEPPVGPSPTHRPPSDVGPTPLP